MSNPLSLVNASIKRSVLILYSGIHNRCINLDDLTNLGLLKPEDLKTVNENDQLDPHSMFNKAYSATNKLNADLKTSDLNIFLKEFQNPYVRNTILHPSNDQILNLIL